MAGDRGSPGGTAGGQVRTSRPPPTHVYNRMRPPSPHLGLSQPLGSGSIREEGRRPRWRSRASCWLVSGGPSWLCFEKCRRGSPSVPRLVRHAALLTPPCTPRQAGTRRDPGPRPALLLSRVILHKCPELCLRFPTWCSLPQGSHENRTDKMPTERGLFQGIGSWECGGWRVQVLQGRGPP